MPSRIVILLFTASVAAQQPGSAQRTNPFRSPADRAEGERLYLSQCAACHGKDAKGAAGVTDLTTGVFRRASTDEGLFQVISKGVPGTTMAGSAMSEREVWQVVTYLRSLSPGQSPGQVQGDRERGARIFEKSGCRECHSLTAAESALGPDLRSAAASRSPAELRQSILDPDRQVSFEYWRVTATTREGRTVSGFRLNEDTFTLQLREASGRLLTLDKSSLARHELTRKSPMPSFAGKLSEQEQEDLLAFLVSLIAARAGGGLQ